MDSGNGSGDQLGASKFFDPSGDGERVQVLYAGGIEWTIKDGIPYHVPTLMREVKDMVAGARRGRTTTP